MQTPNAPTLLKPNVIGVSFGKSCYLIVGFLVISFVHLKYLLLAQQACTRHFLSFKFTKQNDGISKLCFKTKEPKSPDVGRGLWCKLFIATSQYIDSKVKLPSLYRGKKRDPRELTRQPSNMASRPKGFGLSAELQRKVYTYIYINVCVG